MTQRVCGFLLVALLALCACGGGGSGGGGGSSLAVSPPADSQTTAPGSSATTTPTASGGTSPTPVPHATATATAAGSTMAGTVVEIPVDAYGPATIAGVTYQSADAAQSTPLVGATVVVGPVPIVGATAPAALPTGDVATTTTAGGAFSVTPAVAPAAPATSEPFVIPPDNITGFAAPATGYYVQVFGPGADGLSAGVPLPLHRFVAASTSLMLRISTASAAEAGAIAAVNGDRAANGAGPLIFDESAEEAARLHASDMAAKGYTCHYDSNDVGPASRYLQVGGIGLTGESVEDGIASTASVAFSVADAAFMGEKTQSPPGGHYENNVDPTHTWAGLGAVASAVYGGNYSVDYELVTGSAQDPTAGASGYTNSGCYSGIAINNS